MKIAFAFLLIDHPRLLQQVIGHVSAYGVAFEVEIDIHVLSEARRVIVPVRLGIAERFQYRVRLNEDVLDPGIYERVISNVTELAL